MDSKFIYRPDWKIFLIAFIFFGISMASFVLIALNNSKGAILFHLIVLSAEQATIIYWVFAILSMGFVFSSTSLLYVRFFTEPGYLVISTELVRIPKILLKKERVIRFSEVTDIKEYSVKSSLILEIHSGAKKAGISNRMLESNDEYEKVKMKIIDYLERFKK